MGRDFPGGPVPKGLTAKVVVGFQWLSCVQLFATLWTTAHQAPLSFTVSQSLLKLMSTESLMLSNHLILCHPFSFYLQSFFLPSTQHQDISDELAHQVVKILALQLQQQSFQ